jgi:hypothetical protein
MVVSDESVEMMCSLYRRAHLMVYTSLYGDGLEAILSSGKYIYGTIALPCRTE